ncbi:MAG: hypothetical protein PHI81_08465 [Synergistaceae bacterium]|jgi:LAO/AO transport system kinase|nr:hypothetical protein [Synergistaceae bacterium]MDD3390265.1 hypothetical protein [Synergistaceae bacterium]MDD3690046.1 hypothetical protein [Synergistaceae bacterium]MDD4021784.1 hypothetical protein [Synergistaceae bacterium]MDD4612858.1 hypothetical protein [Synergistaceae bacterium]
MHYLEFTRFSDSNPAKLGEKLEQPLAEAPRQTKLTVNDYVEGILLGNRMLLSKAIMLMIESNDPKHFETGQEIVQKNLPHSGGGIRIGIIGVPGAGKSTTIEALGSLLCDMETGRSPRR